MSHEQSLIKKYVFSTDHKVIGLQYLITGILMAFIGGYLAYIFRMQLAFPGISIPLYGKLDPTGYNTSVTMHGTIMIFWVAMPILLAAFGNLLIPLMVGADDMAFPKLNMLSYWVFFVSSVILLLSFFVPGGAFGGAWTAYPPLSADAYQHRSFWEGLGGHLWIVAVALEFIAFLIGGINFLVTTINMRAKGLTMWRLPILVWMMITSVLIFMFSVGPLIAGAVMLLLDRTVGTGFYDPARGGDPILFQHFFWFFGHPEVYVILLPGIGLTIEVMTTMARKTVFGYKAIIYSTIGAGFLSFIVWAHHQFIAGIDPRMSEFFSLTTILISIPFSIIIFSMIAILYRSAITFSTGMLFAIGFIAEFILGGVTGIYLGSAGFDIYAHDTYFVIAHFHYALFPTVVFAGMAGVYHWYPKFVGKMYDETLGKLHFWGTTIFFNIVFIPLFFGGLKGEQRRIFDYSKWPSLMTSEMKNYRIIATIAFIGLFISQFIFAYNMIKSWKSGKKAEANPWKSNTLEWSVASPPPHGNFEKYPIVYRGAYEYSTPDHKEDYWPQHLER